MITSRQNPFVKELVALRKDGGRRAEQGLFSVEGVRAVKSALDGGAQIERIVHSAHMTGPDSPLLKRAQASGIETVEISSQCFRKVSSVKEPQGILALVKYDFPAASDVFSAANGLFVLAVGIQDPGNMGTMIRTAAAFGASGFLAAKPCADITSPRVVRATAGSMFLLPCARVSLEEALGAAAKLGIRIFAASAREGVDYREAQYSRPVALAFGSEAHGLPDALERAAAERVTIPMAGGVESLNAAAAAAIVLAHATRQGTPAR